MSLQVTSTNNVKVYTVAGAGAKALPDWLERRQKAKLKKNYGKLAIHCVSGHACDEFLF